MLLAARSHLFFYFAQVVSKRNRKHRKKFNCGRGTTVSGRFGWESPVSSTFQALAWEWKDREERSLLLILLWRRFLNQRTCVSVRFDIGSLAPVHSIRFVRFLPFPLARRDSIIRFIQFEEERAPPCVHRPLLIGGPCPRM